MKNWLNQEIEIGDLVYYGARSGNTSTYRLGRVTGFSEKNDESPLVRIEWIAEPGAEWERVPDPDFLRGRLKSIPVVRQASVNKSSLGIDCIVKVDVDLDSIDLV